MSDHSYGRTDEEQRGVLVPNSAASDSNYDSSHDSAREDSPSAEGYFVKYGIIAGPTEDFASLFNRLAIKEDWSKQERRRRRPEAIAGEIDAIYGTDTTKLEKWQDLCRDVGIEPVPTSNNGCKKALRGVHVNLVNLIDHRRSRAVPLKVFPSYQALREWTFAKSCRIFPKKAAKEEGFIKALLKDFRRG